MAWWLEWLPLGGQWFKPHPCHTKDVEKSLILSDVVEGWLVNRSSLLTVNILAHMKLFCDIITTVTISGQFFLTVLYICKVLVFSFVFFNVNFFIL